MRPFKAFCMILVSLSSFRVAEAATASDHLLPPDSEAKYRAVLTNRLCVTPFNCGRFIMEPPFERGEICLSIYSVGSDTDSAFRATCTEAVRSLRDWSDAGRLPNRAKQVTVRRQDAPVSVETATLLREVWTRMLSGAQKPRPWEHATEKDYIDPTEAEFSISSGKGQVLTGITPLVDPELGPKVHQFVELSEALITYVKAPGIEKERQVRTRARRLLAELKHS